MNYAANHVRRRKKITANLAHLVKKKRKPNIIASQMIYRSSTINTRLYEVSSRVPSLKKHRLKHPIIIPPAIFSTRSFVYVKDASIISKQILRIRIRKKIIILHHPCILFLSFFYTHKINLCENSICNLHTLYTQDEMGENANENFS